MKIGDITTRPYAPRMCMYNVKYDDDYSSGYSSGKSAGYEQAKKEFDAKLDEERSKMIVRGFAPKFQTVSDTDKRLQNFNEYVSTNTSKKVNSIVGKISESLIGTDITPTIPLFYTWDIPKQNNLPKSNKLCGYVEIDGNYIKCNSCEHEKIIRQVIWENETFRKRYFETPASFYDAKPAGMLQEEYFAMKDLGFVKISSFKDTPNEMIVFWYNTLTYKQTDLIYPR